MSANWALQQAIYSLLRGDATLRSLLAVDTDAGSPTQPAVYDDEAPQPAAAEDGSGFPYVLIGDHTAINWDTDDVDGQEHTLTLHAFSRHEGKKEVQQIVDAIHNALHDRTLDVAGHSAVYCYWEFSATIPDPDIRVRHCVTRYRIVTQQS